MAAQGWTSNRSAAQAQLLRAVDAGLTAAATLYAGEITRRLKQGYTSGQFVTGNVASSVTIGTPEWRDSKRWIAVGTNNEYALYWEIGHVNLFMADWAHKPIWVPTLEELAPQLRAAFTSAFDAVMNGGGAQ